MPCIPLGETAYAREVAAGWWKQILDGELSREGVKSRLAQLYAPRAVLIRWELNRLRIARQNKVYTYDLTPRETEQMINEYNLALPGAGE
ncbi:hypothetical protein [Pontibacterium sp.]|uniref:hypothetical protein n=1 Tax=Pontibacterium sp. TaxID=2036026 RepID=UPI00356A58D0